MRDAKWKVITAAQTNALCTFFEENPEVIRGYKKTAKCIEAVQNKWINVTPLLNSLGPPRSHKAWAKYLCDTKAKLKKKRIKWKQDKDGNGHVICNADDINEMKLRMLQVLTKEAFTEQHSQESIMLDQDAENSSETYEEQNDNDTIGGHSNSTKETLFSVPFDQHGGKHVIGDNNKSKCADEFDAFGKVIGQQLRTLPLAVALETEEMLLAVLRKQRLKLQRQDYTTHIDPLIN